MALYIITGNKEKYEEISAIIPGAEQLEVDLPEIQDIDPRNVIKAKLVEAYKQKDAEFVVEDTSLSFKCLNGLPGPLIKWFLKTIGNEGLFDIAEKMGDHAAEAKTMIVYARRPDEMFFFEGSMKGEIVRPRGKSGFGWDPIFQPEGFSKSFAEWTREEKNERSMRRIALNKLHDFLEEKDAFVRHM